MLACITNKLQFQTRAILLMERFAMIKTFIRQKLSLSSFNSFSTTKQFVNQKIWMPRRVAKLGLFVGLFCTPLAVWSAYEQFNPLPAPFFNTHYPLMAKYYIRRALLADPIESKAFYLDQAMQTVLSSGLGAASPQSTNLVIYLSKLYLENVPNNIENLQASFVALTHKPHVGEGVIEEKARLLMAMKIADRLIEIIPDEMEKRNLAQKIQRILDKSPNYLKSIWETHPIRSKVSPFLV